MKVLIEQRAYDQIVCYCTEQTKYEWTAFAHVDVDGENFVISDVRIPKQENTSASSDIEPEDLNNLDMEFTMDGKDMRCWIHHHNTMSAFWSTTDMENMKTLTVSGSWFVSIVTNNKLEMRAAFYSNQDPMPVFVDQLPIEVKRGDCEQYQAWAKELKDKSSHPKTTAPTRWNGWGNYTKPYKSYNEHFKEHQEGEEKMPPDPWEYYGPDCDWDYNYNYGQRGDK